ncbi:MAG: hypothetical protein DLD55_06405 [candidate division SR1 bacterium]|nr:MAG: hypothetical protein DLD55_06405 [candidate division SR1 bacterium]
MKDYNRALEYEIFIKEEYAFAKNQIKAAKVIFDIGGHIGLFSQWCLQLNPQAQIFFFEPFFQHLEQAKERLQAFAEQISFFPYAVGEQEGSQTFLFCPQKSMQSGKFRSFLNPTGQEQEIEVTKLNPYLENPEIERIEVLKLDIEGMEFEVLNSLSELAWAKVESLICEVHVLSPEFEQEWEVLKRALQARFQVMEWKASPYTEKIGICFCQKNP